MLETTKLLRSHLGHYTYPELRMQSVSLPWHMVAHLPRRTKSNSEGGKITVGNSQRNKIHYKSSPETRNEWINNQTFNISHRHRWCSHVPRNRGAVRWTHRCQRSILSKVVNRVGIREAEVQGPTKFVNGKEHIRPGKRLTQLDVRGVSTQQMSTSLYMLSRFRLPTFAPWEVLTISTGEYKHRRMSNDAIFVLCRNNQWQEVLANVSERPLIAVEPMTMDNHIATTILHQAITSKGETDERAAVISTILRNTPKAAEIKNGYGSLPLHVIAQRNTKINAATKERLIHELIKAHAGALVESGGVGKRTPLHIIFTDYVSPELTKDMIEKGSKACFMPDKKGYLPAHVACSRHCSPEKLRMLLDVNPQALFDKTNKGETVLDLATKTATKSHPNYALIEELNRQISSHNGVNTVSSEDDSEGTASRRPRAESTESIPKAWQNLEPTPYNPRYETNTFMTVNPPPALVAPPMYHHHPTPITYHPHHHHHPYNNVMDPHAPLAYSTYPMEHYPPPPPPPPPPPTYGYYTTTNSDGYTTPTRKRKAEEVSDVDPAANLLLHFSRKSAAQPFEV